MSADDIAAAIAEVILIGSSYFDVVFFNECACGVIAFQMYGSRVVYLDRRGINESYVGHHRTFHCLSCSKIHNFPQRRMHMSPTEIIDHFRMIYDVQ